ncbi:unnamed protein product [Dracunculus medinensis]|uniref:U4/U6.U5 tri-snRNP-associated protein 1 n=1 Tax=Dracunculus medinensis TaxID=318479 RepID=A0A0N4U4D0_DRAME|nr:unnamed protein product [Dracunculus medinensis]
MLFRSRRQEKSRNLSGSPHRRKNERARDSSSPPARRSRRTRDSSSPPFRKRAKSRDSPQEESLSIEETNKLRAKLGLAPLDVNDKSKSADKNSGQEANEGEVFVEDGMQYVHKAAEHIGDKKRAEEMREKLQVMREKRKLHDKLSKVKGLADSDSDDDTSSWVTKTRELEEQRRRAEERVSQNSLIFYVLDAGDEILINPNMIENQRYARNAELRKKKDRYEPYAEDIDEFGLPKDKGLLSKYDEELNGEERKTFRLDEMGEVDIEKERQEMEIRRRLFMANKKLESLDSYQYKVASEFYSQEEMLSFRKPKRKKDTKKMRKRKEKILKDLVGGVDLTGVLVDDDAEEELSAMLHRARKVRTLEVKKESGENDAAARVYEMLVKEEPMEANENPESGLVIDSTMEYCRNLERDLSRGVGAMMKLAAEKGYLDTSHVQKVNGPSLKHLESKRFSQIEISRYDIEEKYTKKLERMGTTGTGPIRPFPEKVDYTPDIRINYVDERGREMEPKDAFRVLSWKFHGKGPGKKQIEKRQAKIDKKELMKKMNSMDTPLGTLNKQLKKQESMQTPYIILSGSGRDTGAPLKKE